MLELRLGEVSRRGFYIRGRISGVSIRPGHLGCVVAYLTDLAPRKPLTFVAYFGGRARGFTVRPGTSRLAVPILIAARHGFDGPLLVGVNHRGRRSALGVHIRVPKGPQAHRPIGVGFTSPREDLGINLPAADKVDRDITDDANRNLNGVLSDEEKAYTGELDKEADALARKADNYLKPGSPLDNVNVDVGHGLSDVPAKHIAADARKRVHDAKVVKWVGGVYARYAEALKKTNPAAAKWFESQAKALATTHYKGMVGAAKAAVDACDLIVKSSKEARKAAEQYNVWMKRAGELGKKISELAALVAAGKDGKLQKELAELEAEYSKAFRMAEDFYAKSRVAKDLRYLCSLYGVKYIYTFEPIPGMELARVNPKAYAPVMGRVSGAVAKKTGTSSSTSYVSVTPSNASRQTVSTPESLLPLVFETPSSEELAKWVESQLGKPLPSPHEAAKLALEEPKEAPTLEERPEVYAHPEEYIPKPTSPIEVGVPGWALALGLGLLGVGIVAGRWLIRSSPTRG